MSVTLRHIRSWAEAHLPVQLAGTPGVTVNAEPITDAETFGAVVNYTTVHGNAEHCPDARRNDRMSIVPLGEVLHRVAQDAAAGTGSDYPSSSTDIDYRSTLMECFQCGNGNPDVQRAFAVLAQLRNAYEWADQLPFVWDAAVAGKASAALGNATLLQARRDFDVPNADGLIPLEPASADPDGLLGPWWPQSYTALRTIVASAMVRKKDAQDGWDGSLRLLTPSKANISPTTYPADGLNRPYLPLPNSMQEKVSRLTAALAVAPVVAMVHRPAPGTAVAPVFAVPATALRPADTVARGWVDLGPARTGTDLETLVSAFAVMFATTDATQPVVDALLQALDLPPAP